MGQHVGGVLRIDMAADAHRPEPGEPRFAPGTGAAEDEDLVAAADEPVGNHLLERGILLDRRPIGEEAAGADRAEGGRVERADAVVPSAGEEVAPRHDVDAFGARRHVRRSTYAPSRACARAASAFPSASRQRARSR